MESSICRLDCEIDPRQSRVVRLWSFDLSWRLLVLSRVQPAHTKDSLVSGLARFSSLQAVPSGTEVLQLGASLDCEIHPRQGRVTRHWSFGLWWRLLVLSRVQPARTGGGEHKFNGEFCRNLLTKRYGK